MPCKDRIVDKTGREVFIETSEEDQRARYLEYIKDELTAQDAAKQDGRCVIPDGKGKVKRCPCRIPEKQRMMVKGCLYIMSSEFLNSAVLVPSNSADALMTDVVQYIADHYKSDISLQDIAREKGYSYHYLSRTFNKIFNINFKSMLNQYRMEYAYYLLQDTTLPIGQIAFESGFQSIRSLDHVCRQTYGRSPKEMRKEHYV